MAIPQRPRRLSWSDPGRPPGRPHPGRPQEIGAAAELYWKSLNAENRVSLLVKFIDAKSGASEVRLVNKHKPA